jgi:hypothetical protein
MYQTTRHHIPEESSTVLATALKYSYVKVSVHLHENNRNLVIFNLAEEISNFPSGRYVDSSPFSRGTNAIDKYITTENISSKAYCERYILTVQS